MISRETSPQVIMRVFMMNSVLLKGNGDKILVMAGCHVKICDKQQDRSEEYFLLGLSPYNEQIISYMDQ